MKKIFPFRGLKGENKPSEPENGICGPKSVKQGKIYLVGSKR
jgi:hypothetical protein